MNFELGGHIVQNAEPKKKKENDLPKKTSKLPQKQPIKERSPNTQWIDSSLRPVKTDSHAEGRAW